MPEVEQKAQRLFVGIPIPAATSEKIFRRLPQQIPGKLAPLQNWHFTLRFLGATQPDRREHLIDELRTVESAHQFEIQFDQLGAFPNARRARVVWLGVGGGAERLSALARTVESAAVAAGFDPEQRRFSPHLTLSRLRDPQPVTHLLAGHKSVGEKMRVTQVILYESRMGGPHSQYSVVKAFPLS